jgi:hypothetical protein
MKRTLAALQRDEREKQEDDGVRAEQLREEAAENARRKEEKKVSKFTAKWGAILAQWDEMRLISVGARGITLPVPNPHVLSL